MSATAPPDPVDGDAAETTHSLDPDLQFIYENCQNSALFREYLYRLTTERDLHVGISAKAAERGLGKTTLAYCLSSIFDIYQWSPDKATLDAREYVRLKVDVPPGSCLLLDETGQAADARRSMSKENVGLGHAIATGRYRQVHGVYTLPSMNELDSRIQDYLDFHIKVTDRGIAEVRQIVENSDEEIVEQHVESIYWPDLAHHDVWQELHQKRVDYDQEGMSKEWIHIDEFEEAKKNFWRKATQKARFDIVRGLHESPNCEMNQAEIGSAVGRDNEDLQISQQTVSRIVRADSFDEVYDPAE